MPPVKGSSSKTRKRKPHVLSDGLDQIVVVKSFSESSKSLVSPDFADKNTWFGDTEQITDEVATADVLYKEYSFAPNSADYPIDLDKITDRAEYPSLGVTVKKNDVVVTSGFTIKASDKKVIFDSANDPLDVIKVSYFKAKSSKFDLIAPAGKSIYLDYVETQFSVGSTFNDNLVFELRGDLGAGDQILAQTKYMRPHDFLSKGNHGSQLKAFGGLTKDVNIFPWNYLTGFRIKPSTEPINPSANEFHSIRMYLENDLPYTDCEIATGTFYCLIKDL